MVALLAVPALSIPAGYLTLSELGAKLGSQGVAVRVSPSCADDVYAIRAPRTDWPSLRAALVADGRLAISEDGGTWSIALDAANRAAERRALAEYEESVRAQLHEIYELAARRVRERWPLSAERRDQEMEEEAYGLNPDPVRWTRSEIADSLAWSAVAERDYARVAVPSLLTAPGLPFGTVWTADAMQVAPVLVPNGNVAETLFAKELVGKASDADAVRKLRAATFAGKLVWDPLTLTVGYRWSFWTPEFSRILDQTDGDPLVAMLAPKSSSDELPTPLSPKTGWHFSAPASDGAWSVEETMPKGAIFASEAALRWSEASGVSVVDYVSPLGDLPLIARPNRSLSEIARDADAGNLDPPWIWGMVHQRTGLEVCRPWNHIDSLPPARRLTLLKAGSFAIARTENRYLDRLVPRGLNLPTAWRNLRLKNALPSLDEIVRAVAKLEPKGWTGGHAPLGLYDPISLYPFAVLLAADPRLAAEVKVLKPGLGITRAFAKLPSGAVFRAALQRVAPFNDAVVYGMLDPIFLPQIVHDESVPLSLRIERSASSLSLRVGTPKTEGGWYGKLVWDATVRLPQ